MITRPLTEADIAIGVDLIITDFQPNQPLTKTFAANFPNLQLSIGSRRQLWSHWITVSIDKNLTLGLFDTLNGNMLAGLTICKDINYDLPEIQEQYSDTLTEEKCFVELEQLFLSGLGQDLQDELRKEGTAFDIMIVVVSKQYQGKGLSQLLIAESQKLGLLSGFKYSYCQASNFKTTKSLIRNGYTKLYEIDLRQFVVEEVKPFQNINEEDRYPSSWIKKLTKS